MLHHDFFRKKANKNLKRFDTETFELLSVTILKSEKI